MATGFLDLRTLSPAADTVPSGWEIYNVSGLSNGVTSGDATDEGSEYGITASAGGDAGLFVSNEAGRLVGALMWTSGPDIADGDVAFLMKLPNMTGTGFSTPSWGLIFRGHVGGTAGIGGTGDVDGLSAAFRETSRHLQINQDGGSWAVPNVDQDAVNLRVEAATHGFTAGDKLWMRINYEGTALKIRYWADGDSEPETWAIEHTEVGLDTATGYFGWGGVTGDGAAGNDDVWLLQAIGWSDDPAEPAPLTGGGGGGGAAPGGVALAPNDRFADRGRHLFFRGL